jgi:hypothetical protein
MIKDALSWQDKRPLILENNQCWAQSLVLLVGEFEELEAAAADFHDGLAPAEDVASEAADIILLGITLLRSLGFDPEKAVRGKLQRNDDKYPAEELVSGDYEEKMQNLKHRWNERKKTENIVYMSPAKL